MFLSFASFRFCNSFSSVHFIRFDLLIRTFHISVVNLESRSSNTWQKLDPTLSTLFPSHFALVCSPPPLFSKNTFHIYFIAFWRVFVLLIFSECHICSSRISLYAFDIVFLILQPNSTSIERFCNISYSLLNSFEYVLCEVSFRSSLCDVLALSLSHTHTHPFSKLSLCETLCALFDAI